MNVPSLEIPCPGCGGRGAVPAGRGLVLACPGCGGAGRAARRVKRQKFDYFFPVFEFDPPAGSTPAITQELQFDDDAFFEQMAWVASILGNDTVVEPGATAIQITDLATGFVFSNAPLQLSNFASGDEAEEATTGTRLLGATYPFPLLAPFIWRPGALISATVTMPTPSAAGPSLFLQVGLKGYKLYAPDGGPLALPEETVQEAAA